MVHCKLGEAGSNHEFVVLDVTEKGLDTFRVH